MARVSRPLLALLVVNFVDTLGFSLVMPFLVFVVTRLGGNAFVYGLVSAVYPACQLASAPALGRWSDRAGRRRVLLVCEVGTIVGWVVLAAALALPVTTLAHVHARWTGPFTLTLPLLLVFAARACDGLTAGNASVASAYVADVTPAQERSASFGLMGVSSNLGFVVGPALAGVLGATRLGAQLPVYATLAVSVVAALLIAFYLPETHPPAATPRPPPDAACDVLGKREWRPAPEPPRRGLRAALAIPHVARMLALYFATFLAFNLYYAAFPVHAVRNLRWGIAATGAYFAALSVLMVAVQAVVLPRASARLRDATLVVVGAAMLAGTFALLLSRNVVAVGVSLVLFALGNGVMWPSAVAMLSRFAGDEAQGAVQGLASSVSSLASIAGLIAGGAVFEALGAGTFVLAAVFIAVAGGLALPLTGGGPARDRAA